MTVEKCWYFIERVENAKQGIITTTPFERYTLAQSRHFSEKNTIASPPPVANRYELKREGPYFCQKLAGETGGGGYGNPQLGAR